MAGTKVRFIHSGVQLTSIRLLLPLLTLAQGGPPPHPLGLVRRLVGQGIACAAQRAIEPAQARGALSKVDPLAGIAEAVRGAAEKAARAERQIQLGGHPDPYEGHRHHQRRPPMGGTVQVSGTRCVIGSS
jgi:hypothetical protein